MAGDNTKSVLTKSQTELIGYLFGSHSSAKTQLTKWIATSPRYSAFVDKYKDKIRKKLRVTRDPGATADLLYELQIPYWLLHDRRFETAYEPYSAGKTRGPDFAITFRTNFTFNIEVTHIRKLAATPIDEMLIDLRWVDVLCSKLRQLPANVPNLLFIASTAAIPISLDLATHLAWIKSRAESRDQQFYTRHRFLNPADFFKHYERLTGLVLLTIPGSHQISLWLNAQARIKLPNAVKNALYQALK